MKKILCVVILPVWYFLGVPGALLKENLRRSIAGGRLLNVVDPDKGY